MDKEYVEKKILITIRSLLYPSLRINKDTFNEVKQEMWLCYLLRLNKNWDVNFYHIFYDAIRNLGISSSCKSGLRALRNYVDIDSTPESFSTDFEPPNYLDIILSKLNLTERTREWAIKIYRKKKIIPQRK